MKHLGRAALAACAFAVFACLESALPAGVAANETATAFLAKVQVVADLGPARKPFARGPQAALLQARAEADVAAAVAYLRRSPRARALFARLAARSERIVLIVDAVGETSFGTTIKGRHPVMWWDPHDATRSAHGETISPALSLMHEAVHALHEAENPRAKDVAGAITTPDYDNREERRTMVYGEASVARELGEQVRTDHHGVDHRVDDPTGR